MEKDLTHGNTLKLIISFCIPLIGGAIFQQLYNVVDTMIVGRFVGVDALAAVGSTGSLNFLIIGFVLGFLLRKLLVLEKKKECYKLL